MGNRTRAADHLNAEDRIFVDFRRGSQLSDDLRPLLGPGSAQRLDVRLVLPATAPPGVYQMFLWLPDPAPALARRIEYSIRLANAGIWRDQGRSGGMNELTAAAQPLVVEARGRARASKSKGAIPFVPLRLGVGAGVP